jgi:lipoprotein-anchoring transpeptidase ErfK/SrfK
MRLRPARNGVLRARLAGTAVRSDPVELSVAPRVEARAGQGVAFVGVPLRLRVAPFSYGGRAVVRVLRQGTAVAAASGRVHRGALRLDVPAPGIGRFALRVELAAASGLAETVVSTAATATARTLQVGSRGSDVLALRRRLAELRFYVPGPSALFDSKLFDSVVAFQKAQRLERNGVIGASVWRALGTAGTPRARYRMPARHIEVDKRRQILLNVVGGEVAGVLPVSSGATGNTPEGAWHILWKAPATSTWLGNAILYRTMTFHTNFAIHGFYSVPTYPASHGCVRIPVWAANWLYEQSPVGERVYVYE